MFASVKNEKELAKASKFAKLQLEAWEKVLALRISMQKSIDLANQLPIISEVDIIANADNQQKEDIEEEYSKLSQSLQHVSGSLVDMLEQQAKVRKIDVTQSKLPSYTDDNEIDALWNRINSVDKALESSLWFPVLNKWHTRVHFGAEKNKSKLKVFNQNISDQIEQAMHDERRVLEKSHLLAQESNRLDLKHFSAQLFPSSSSSFQTFSSSANHADSLVSEEELTRLHEQLGVFTEQPLTSDVLALAGGLPGDEDEAEHNPLADVPESELRKRKRLFDLEVYDDRAFYSLLLKTFISANQSGSGANSLGLNAEDLAQLKKFKRGKTASKHVDRKASKGRRIRYTVHQKLQHFMFPIPKSVLVASSVSGGMSSVVDSDRLLASLFQ